MSGLGAASCGSAEVLEPAFDPLTLTYSAGTTYQCYRTSDLWEHGQNITLTPTCNATCSSIQVWQPTQEAFEAVASGASVLVNLKGEALQDTVSSIPVKVTAQDGTSEAVYTLDITRSAKSDVTTLGSLSVDCGSGEEQLRFGDGLLGSDSIEF